MQVEKQVCTLKQGERLEELGIIVKPLFCYCMVSTSSEDSYDDLLPTQWNLEGLPELATTWQAPAFTASEISSMLPIELKGKTKGLTLSKYRRNDGLWFVYYSYTLKDESMGENERLMESSITNYSETQAAAEMLIYLLENKLVDVEACNSRLVA